MRNKSIDIEKTQNDYHPHRILLSTLAGTNSTVYRSSLPTSFVYKVSSQVRNSQFRCLFLLLPIISI